MTEFITDKEIYTRVIRELVLHTNTFVWIATADIKDMYVEHNNKMVPFLAVMDDMIRHRISIRLIHAKEPGKRFRDDFDTYPLVIKNLE